MNNGRDCPHGRQVGKCDTCDLIEAEKEIEALKAQVEQLKDALQAALVNSPNPLSRALIKNIELALELTPAQCLAEIKAQAVEDAATELASIISAPPGIYSGAVIKLNLIANKLRQQAKAGG